MPAYLMAAMTVHDPIVYKEYIKEVPSIVTKHEGHYIIRGGTYEVVEGSWPGNRVAVIEFPTYEKALSFVSDPEYRPIAEIRHKSTTSDVWLTEGVTSNPDTKSMKGFLLGNIIMENMELYNKYAERVPDVFERLEGTYLARGGKCEVIEGNYHLDRVVIGGFLNKDSVYDFYKSDAYAPLLEIRTDASDSNIVIIEGI